MEIEARMRLINKGSLVAVGDVVIDNMITLHQVKVLSINHKGSGENKVMVSLPRRQTQNGWKNMVGFIKPELKKVIEDAVLQEVWKEAKRPLPQCDWEISVHLYEGKNGLKGYAAIVNPGVLEITGIQIRESDGELKVVYPYALSGKQVLPLLDPADITSKERIEKEIIETYLQEKAERKIREHTR